MIRHRQHELDKQIEIAQLNTLRGFQERRFVVVGERGLCVFCTTDYAEAERFAGHMVAKVRIVQTNREYERGERVR
jgi:photosystem II stability/assembly factor-like uncharacterized protein